MAQIATCPLGHQWPLSGATPPTCPQCGAVGRPSAETAAPVAATRVDRPGAVPLPPPDLPGGATVSPVQTLSGDGATVAPGADALRLGTDRPERFGYEMLGVLGQGGMGIVYKARDRALNRLVALKMPSTGPEGFARFDREVKAVAHLQHPNIVQVYEVGEHEGRPFCAFEFIEGGSLAAQTRGRPQPPREAAALVEVIARAVHYAHQRGIIHRDLKPANILLATASENPSSPATGHQLLAAVPKIADFGLAKQFHAEGLTHTGDILGTPGYMAPEQATGVNRTITPLADVYALGAVLYELLTGQVPFRADNPVDAIVRMLSEDPVPPRRLNPRVPRDLETICLKCLQKDPKRRYASAEALADDLRRFGAGESIQGRPAPSWERAVKWARRRPTRVALLGTFALLVLLGLAAGLWYWNAYLREHVSYYANVTRRWGVLEGVGPVSEEQARHRYFTYKFYRRAGRVERVEVVNGRGVLSTRHPEVDYLDDPHTPSDEEHACRYEYHRNDQGRVEEVAFNRAGTVVWTFHFTTATTGYYTDRRGFPAPRGGSGAAYVEFTWSPEGFELVRHSFDREGKPQPDANGSFGVRSEVDERGLPVRATFLGLDDRPAFSRRGHAGIERTFDALGNWVRISILDRDGRPAWHSDGYAGGKRVYDEAGNLVEQTYLDTAGHPAAFHDGYARVTITCDDYGNRSSASYYDAAGQPTLNASGCAQFRWVSDDRGNIVQEDFLDQAGRPTLCKDGYARVLLAYDEHANRIGEQFLGLDGKPALCENGYARFSAAFDEHGNCTEQAYFGLDDKPTPHKDGWARITTRYDEHGDLVEEAYFGTDGLPTLGQHGYHRVVRTYDNRHNLVEAVCYDCAGKPTRNKEGYARWKESYDQYGHRTGVSYHEPDGSPAYTADGYHRFSSVYDAQGQETEISYWDAAGRLTACKGGFARRTLVHDARGNILEQRYFDREGKPTLYQDGYARYTSAYDDRGHATEVVYYGTDGQAVPCHEGYARLRWAHDDRGNKLSEEYLDANGQPVERKGGYVKIAWKYDDRGHVIEAHYFDRAGQPARVDGTYSLIRYTLDPYGRILRLAYFGADDQPVLVAEGYAGWTHTYDDRGHQTSVAYFDRDDHATACKDGYARQVWTFDARGNALEMTYYDAAGHPMLLPEDGYCRLTWSYDALGHVREQSYLDIEGRLVRHRRYGFARFTATYDAHGRKTEQSTFDTEGRPTPMASSQGGYARAVWKHDLHGHIIEESYFDVDGQACLATWGAARFTSTYDDHGNQVEHAYFDREGRRVRSRKLHYARRTYTYDERNQRIGATYYDENNQPLKAFVVVNEVLPDSPAERLGLRGNDAIVRYDGQVPASSYQLQYRCRSAAEKQRPRELQIRRDGKVRTLQVTPEALAEVPLWNLVLDATEPGAASRQPDRSVEETEEEDSGRSATGYEDCTEFFTVDVEAFTI